jgi:hypothetical protein
MVSSLFMKVWVLYIPQFTGVLFTKTGYCDCCSLHGLCVFC